MTDHHINPQSLPEDIKMPPTAPSIWGTLLMAVFLVFIPSMIMGLLFGFYANIMDIESVGTWFSSIEVQLALMCASLPLAGYFVILFTKAFGGSTDLSSIFNYLRLAKVSLSDALKWVLISIGVWLSIGAFGTLADLPEEQFMLMVRDSQIHPLLVIAVVCLLAPIVEEVIFRGLIFKRFQQSKLATTGAAVMTCLTFTLIHAQQYTLAGLFIIFMIAVYLTIVRIKTNNTSLSIIAHATNNILSTVALYFWS